jgi:hypothetical protein
MTTRPVDHQRKHNSSATGSAGGLSARPPLGAKAFIDPTRIRAKYAGYGLERQVRFAVVHDRDAVEYGRSRLQGRP